VLRSSIPVGRLFGAEIRLHLSFPLLLIAAILYSTIATQNPLRGVGLWMALCVAVAAREIARAIAAVYAGMHVRAVFLLPVGGVMALTPPPGQSEPAPWPSRIVSAAGPIANFALGLVLLAGAYAVDPHVSLLAPPWISAAHVLRSFVWCEFILGTVGMLPVSTLTSQRFLAGRRRREAGAAIQPEAPAPPAAVPAPETVPAAAKPVKSGGFTMPPLTLGSVLALAMIIGGLVLQNHLWLVMLGFFMLLYSQITATPALTAGRAETILVREVMLTEYTLLSTADTLRDALERTVHSLQDVFPVVRGNTLVGSVARATLANRLMIEGDGYLQGVMTRTMQFAAPGEKLVDALRRSAALGASEFIPVVENGAVLGILTPQSLSRAVQQTAMMRTRDRTGERELP
jgi:CBS domain-containing protein